MNPAVWSISIAAAALLVSTGTAVFTVRQRRRQEAAAVTADLYPVLRQLRDSAWQWGKPLGGQGSDHLIAVHNGLIDLADLTPAIADRTLAQRCRELLEHEVAGVAMSIDPARFMGLFVAGDELPIAFTEFAKRAGRAVERCQSLRRGAA